MAVSDATIVPRSGINPLTIREPVQSMTLEESPLVVTGCKLYRYAGHLAKDSEEGRLDLLAFNLCAQKSGELKFTLKLKPVYENGR